MKKDKNGFRVVKSGQVYVASQTVAKSSPREEVVEIVRSLWNEDPSIKKMRKHIEKLSIQKVGYEYKYAGMWFGDSQKVVIYDSNKSSSVYYKRVFYHEVIGHAFYQWAYKYRPEEFDAFCKYVTGLRPITNYVLKNEEKWKKVPNKHTPYTWYEDEQHSAAVEVINGLTTSLLTDEEMEGLRQVYERLHY